MTDTSGFFVFLGLPPGRYFVLSAQTQNLFLNAKCVRVTVHAGEITSLLLRVDTYRKMGVRCGHSVEGLVDRDQTSAVTFVDSIFPP